MTVLYPVFPTSAPTDLELTERQAAVMQWALTGRTNAEIAKELGISQAAAQGALLRVLEKAGARNRTELVALVYSGVVRLWAPA